MAKVVSVAFASTLTATVTQDRTVAANMGLTAAGAVNTYASFNVVKTITGTEYSNYKIALSGASPGVATVDFSTLLGINAAALEAIGHKIKALRFTPQSDGVGAYFASGASNGHLITTNGTPQTWKIPVPPGGSFVLDMAAGGTAIANGSNDTIDISGGT